MRRDPLDSAVDAVTHPSCVAHRLRRGRPVPSRRLDPRAVWLLVLAGTLALAVPQGATGAGTGPRDLRDGHGIHVESVEPISARQVGVRVRTDALQHPVDVRILLPDDYDASPKRRFPVLYLFHGTSGRASDWVNFGNAEETTAGLPMIVVMPDAGFNGDGGGWLANWFNGGAGGQPVWETFHVEQISPWTDAHLGTHPALSGRAVAGLSEGRFRALRYGGGPPGLFPAVASFSGGCVDGRDPRAVADATTSIQYTTAALSGVADPDAIFGPRA